MASWKGGYTVKSGITTMKRECCTNKSWRCTEKRWYAMKRGYWTLKMGRGCWPVKRGCCGVKGGVALWQRMCVRLWKEGCFTVKMMDVVPLKVEGYWTIIGYAALLNHCTLHMVCWLNFDAKGRGKSRKAWEGRWGWEGWSSGGTLRINMQPEGCLFFSVVTCVCAEN